MKVLVAEDDLASGKFMQKLLSKYGEVVLARDGIAAVDEFCKCGQHERTVRSDLYGYYDAKD